jgi:hypothetical protein
MPLFFCSIYIAKFRRSGPLKFYFFRKIEASTRKQLRYPGGATKRGITVGTLSRNFADREAILGLLEIGDCTPSDCSCMPEALRSLLGTSRMGRRSHETSLESW